MRAPVSLWMPPPTLEPSLTKMPSLVEASMLPPDALVMAPPTVVSLTSMPP